MELIFTELLRMSGTPECYFQQRWAGMESLAKIVGDRNYSLKRHSVELSLGERLQDLDRVIVNILSCSSEIRDAILEKRVTADELCSDVNALESRVAECIDSLKSGVFKITRMRDEMLISIVNVMAAESITHRDDS
jgi:hypothetical protein